MMGGSVYGYNNLAFRRLYSKTKAFFLETLSIKAADREKRLKQ